MHRFRCASSIGIGVVLLLWPSLLMAQRTSDPQTVSADSQFSEMHASLSAAADYALEVTAPEISSAGPSHRASDSSTQTPGFIADVSSTRRRKEFLALRTFLQPILSQQGIPDSFAAVVLVESGGNPLALSPKGARGLWQLMPDTARRYGLTVNERSDERIDSRKATVAAVHYLRDLYARFGSWPLALAAYNAGEQNVQRAIDRAGTSDFTRLTLLGLLPNETRNYVPAVLAAMGTRNQLIIAPQPESKPLQVVFAIAEQ